MLLALRQIMDRPPSRYPVRATKIVSVEDRDNRAQVRPATPLSTTNHVSLPPAVPSLWRGPVSTNSRPDGRSASER